MHDDSVSEEPESDFNINSIINNISVNNYNNINNIQVNNINEINYIIDINNLNALTNFHNLNNIHTVNNLNANTKFTLNNFSTDSALSTPPGTPDTPGTPNTPDSPGTPNKPKDKDEMNTSFSEKDKKARLFQRTTTNHKRRGSDTESSPKLDEKYQRRHSEGKFLRIAGLREQVSLVTHILWKKKNK